MGGLNAVDKLRVEGNLDVKKATMALALIEDVFVPTEGILAHPRFGDPLDPEMVAHIKANGVEKAILVRRDGMHPVSVNGKKRGEKLRLTLIDGCRRIEHLAEALRQLRAEGSFREGQSYLKVEFFVGSDKEALLERLRRNVDPQKKPDAPSVLAKTAIQLEKAKAMPTEILAAMPRHINSVAILEALLRWPDLVLEAAAIFDAGAPLGLLPAVLSAAREEQVPRLKECIAAGLTDARGATRRLNKDRRATGTASVKIRPRKFFQRIEPHLTGERKAIVAFLRGDDRALDSYPEALQEFVAAGWNSEKGALVRAKKAKGKEP